VTGIEFRPRKHEMETLWMLKSLLPSSSTLNETNAKQSKQRKPFNPPLAL